MLLLYMCPQTNLIDREALDRGLKARLNRGLETAIRFRVNHTNLVVEGLGAQNAVRVVKRYQQLALSGERKRPFCKPRFTLDLLHGHHLDTNL